MRWFLLMIYRRIFSRPCFLDFNLFVYECGLRGIGVLNYEDLNVSGEKYFLSKALPEILGREPRVLVDIGANVGNYTNMLVDLYPSSKIYCFEPNPKVVRILKQRFSSKNVCVFELAVAESNGRAVLYDSSKEGSELASMHREAVENKGDEIFSFYIKTISLDSFIFNEAIGEIDFMKIDIEGAELDALKGCSEALLQRKISCIQLEFNDMNIYNKIFMRDIVSMLQGYNVYRLLPRGMIPLFEWPLFSEIFGYQNIVAIRSDMPN